MNLTQEKILRLIARYKYCTQSQLLTKIPLHYQTMYSNLSTLIELRLLNKIRYAPPTGKGGSLEHLYHLTARGARVMAESLRIPFEEIQVPSRNQVMVANDYFHRISTVNSFMSYDTWLENSGYSNVFFTTYFHKGTGSNRNPEITGKFRSATCLDFPNGSHIDPDAIFMYQKPNNAKYLFCLEVFNGHDTKRVVEQLKKGLSAVSYGLAPKKYNHDKDNRILATFEHESNMQAVLKRLSVSEKLPSGAEKYLFFNVAERVRSTFNSQWIDIQYKHWNLEDF